MIADARANYGDLLVHVVCVCVWTFVTILSVVSLILEAEIQFRKRSSWPFFIFFNFSYRFATTVARAEADHVGLGPHFAQRFYGTLWAESYKKYFGIFCMCSLYHSLTFTQTHIHTHSHIQTHTHTHTHILTHISFSQGAMAFDLADILDPSMTHNGWYMLLEQRQGASQNFRSK